MSSTVTAPPWTTPNNGAWAYRYTGDTEAASPLRHATTLIYTATADGKGTINAVDFATRKLAWSTKLGKGFHATPAYNGSVLYAGNNDGTLYMVDAGTGKVVGTFASGAAIAVQPLIVSHDALPGSHLAFGNTAGTFFVVEIGQSRVLYSFRSFVPAGKEAAFTKAVLVGSLLVFSVSMTESGKSTAHIYALDVTNGAIVHDVTVAADAILSGGVSSGSTVFFGCQSGDFLAFDVTSAEITTLLKTNSPIAGAAACDTDYVYVGSTNGAFYATPLRDDPSLPPWQLPVTEAIITGITLYGGLAYFGGMASSKTTAMFTLDLAAADAQSASVTLDQLQGRVGDTPYADDTYIVFTDAGTGAGTLYAVERLLQTVIDRLSFSSQILPSEYTGQTSPKDAMFQMVVSVVDDNRAPLAGMEVTISASEDVTLLIDGGKHAVSTTRTYTTRTNDYGQIEIDADASDVNMPSLLFHAAFFPPGTYVQFFPDQAMLDKLCTVQPEALGAATDYSGTPVIKETYRTTEKLQSISQAIANTVGRQQNTSTSRAKAQPDLPTRSLDAGAITHFAVDVDEAHYVFNGNPTTTAQTGVPVTAGATKILSGGGFDEFKKKVANGVQKLRHAEWHFDSEANVLVRAIDDAAKGVEYEYKFVIKEIEKAVQVVRALIKEIVTDVKRFMEWLSELLDWKAYLETQKAILGTYEDMLGRFKAYFADPSNAAQITTFLSSLNNSTETFVKQANSLTDSVGSQSQSAGSPQEVFRPKGKDIVPQTNWLVKKIRKDVEPLFGAASPAEKELIAATETFLDAVRAAATTDLVALMETVAHDFTQLFSKPGGFLAQLLPTVLDIFTAIVDAGIDLAIALAEPAFTYVGKLLAVLDRMFKQELAAGPVSELYELLTGEKLTGLGLATLVLAVPTHIISATLELIDNLSKTVMGARLPAKQADIFIAVVYGILGLAWSVQAAFTLPSLADFWICVLYFLAIIGQASSMGFSGEGTVQDWVFWAVQLFPAALAGYQWVIRDDLPATEAAEKWLKKGYFVLGAAFEVMSVIWAAIWPDDYWGDDGVVLAGNVMGNLPLFAPVASTKTGAVLVTMVGYGCASIFAIGGAVEE
ncbi:MAG TPA: PQQ-binding-like beta-propeller repeat protein [Thermoanaerobaculia bacterium]